MNRYKWSSVPKVCERERTMDVAKESLKAIRSPHSWWGFVVADIQERKQANSCRTRI